MSHDAIERYAAGETVLRALLVGLTPADLTARPGPGAWSIHELVIHVVDADLVGADRMKRVIAEENPPLIGFDENLWIARHAPHEQSVEDAVEIFEANRRQMTRILRTLEPEAFERTGLHSERGPLTLLQLVTGFAQHLEHHLQFLIDKRRALGKGYSDHFESPRRNDSPG